MKSYLEVIRLEDRTEEWFQERLKRIGSSEAGSIMNMSEYTPAIKVFDEKIGKYTPERIDNKFTFWGKEMEDLIANIWQYHRGLEVDDYIIYKNRNEIQRKNKRINGIVVNPKYPWLSANLDRVINKGQFRLDDYDLLTESECPLEIKEIDQFAASKWESGVPQQYLFQVIQQCIVLDVEYGEICLKQTDRKLNVIPVILRPTIREAFIEKSKIFMENVEKAKVIYAQMQEAEKNFEMSKYQDLEAELTELEPDVEETDAYVKYMKERYQSKEDEILGTEESLEWIKQYQIGSYVEKVGKTLKTASKANLLRFMEGAAIVENGKEATCSNRSKFTCKFKGEYTDVEIQESINSIVDKIELQLNK